MFLIFAITLRLWVYVYSKNKKKYQNMSFLQPLNIAVYYIGVFA